MNGRSGILLILALICGLGAMFGVNRLMKRPQQAARYREVLAAARDLKVEEVLKPEMVKVVKVSEDTIPPGAFSSFKDVSERWVSLAMLAGDVIVEGKLAPKGAPLGLLPRIPDGMRAYAVEVNEQSGVSGFIMPDHRVDVILAYSSRSGNNDNNKKGYPQSETILQDVPVLAAGQVTTRPEDNKTIQVRTVTLGLTPQQVDILVAARTEGTLTLSLRGLNDHKQVETKPKVEEETRPILVAAAELMEGAVLTPDLVRREQVPRNSLLPDDILTEPAQVNGRKVRIGMGANQPVLASKLMPIGEPKPAVKKARPDYHLTPDMRAVPLKVEELNGGIGLIHAGDFVDVVYVKSNGENPAVPALGGGGSFVLNLGDSGPTLSKTGGREPTNESGEPPAREAQTIIETAPEVPGSELVLQRARVLSTPRDVPTEEDEQVNATRSNVVVLEVPIQDVSKLLWKQANGRLTLLPRHPEDDGRLVETPLTPPETGWIHHGPYRHQRFQIRPGRVELARVKHPELIQHVEVLPVVEPTHDPATGPEPESTQPVAREESTKAAGFWLRQVVQIIGFFTMMNW